MILVTKCVFIVEKQGWISDMNPMQRSSRIAKKYGEMFRNPLDEIDGAARVVDPVSLKICVF